LIQRLIPLPGDVGAAGSADRVVYYAVFGQDALDRTAWSAVRSLRVLPGGGTGSVSSGSADSPLRGIPARGKPVRRRGAR